MEELQLHDLQSIEAALVSSKVIMNGVTLPACDVQQNARPPIHEETIVARGLVRGMDHNKPMFYDGCG